MKTFYITVKCFLIYPKNSQGELTTPESQALIFGLIFYVHLALIYLYLSLSRRYLLSSWSLLVSSTSLSLALRLHKDWCFSGSRTPPLLSVSLLLWYILKLIQRSGLSFRGPKLGPHQLFNQTCLNERLLHTHHTYI